MDCSSGLLQSPSAEMNESGTLMITNNFLNRKALPSRWSYNTFGYGFDISFFSRFELSYICTLFIGRLDTQFLDERHQIMFNQDRHFAAKALLLREGEFGKKWIPSLAVGISDPVTGGDTGEYIEGDISTVGNGFFNRMYIVATKHFNFSIGEVGFTLGYQYNLRQNPHYNAPCAAVTLRPAPLKNRWFNPKFILEFDSLTPNIGFIADIWDSRFQAMFELQGFQWISFGLRYQVRLKGSD